MVFFNSVYQVFIKCSTLLVLSLFLLSACQVHQVDDAPEPSVRPADRFASQPSSHISYNTEALTAPWWNDFKRPALADLIQQSFIANQTLQQARARVQQAAAIAQQTRAQLLPEITLDGSLRSEWEGASREPSTRSVGAALQWEIDLFNRIRSLSKADQLTLHAAVANAQLVRLTLSAEVASAYFGAVAAQRRLSLLNQQIQGDKDLLALLQLRFDSGIGTNVDVLQQRSRVADSESLIPDAQADLRVFENQLDVLLGQMPDGHNRVAANDTLGFARPLPAIGVPTDLLVNRPDLRMARAELVAADFAIGSAIAERLPNIVLSGSSGTVTTDSYSGPLSILLGSFVQPLLDWGRRKAEVQRNRGVYQERLALFTQQFLEAVASVDNALYQEDRQREFIYRLERRRDILQETVAETEARYKQGVDDYLPVLNALQELRDVERELLNERLQMVTFRIQLYRASGGFVGVNNESH